MWFAEDSSPENDHVNSLLDQLGDQNTSLRSQIVLMIRHLCGSFGLELPVELTTIDPQAVAEHSHSHASSSSSSSSKSRSSGPARMVKSFFSFARKSRSKHEKAFAAEGASASSAHSRPIPNSSASSSLSVTTPKASGAVHATSIETAAGAGRSCIAGAAGDAKQVLMDVDERGRSEHEASAEASALEVAGARGESGESGAEGDEGEPDEPELEAVDVEADDAEADLGSDGGDEPDPDVGMNASLDVDFCASPGPRDSEEDAAHLDSSQLELIEKLKKRQYETNLTGV